MQSEATMPGSRRSASLTLFLIKILSKPAILTWAWQPVCEI